MTSFNEKNFERTINGKKTGLFTIQQGELKVIFSNFGARIIALLFDEVNVTPAYPDLEPYMSATIAPYHGATIGRYANRIARGKFSLEGKEYSLPVNNPPNHLHGGPNGFHHQVWDVDNHTDDTISFHYFSKDGEEGYPGNVDVTVTYTTTVNNELLIAYSATTDTLTPFNITNHAFFNLNGEGTILHHQLQINAERFMPVDDSLIPTGELKTVEGTAFDFLTAKKIGADINNNEEQTRIGGGYDHNFILMKEGDELSFAAKAIGDKTGIVMDVFTTEPGIQLFSGNFEAVKGDLSTYRNTFCLETQHFPDSPNQPSFPNTILEAGQAFTSQTVYRFSENNN